jgi:hypothetical protein
MKAQNSQSSGPDMNLEPPEYEAVVPCNWLQCLLITLLFHGQSKGNLAEYMHVSTTE